MPQPGTTTAESEDTPGPWVRYRSLALLAAAWAVIVVLLISWGVADVLRVHARTDAADVAADRNPPSAGPVEPPVALAQLTPRNELETLARVPFHRDLDQQRRVIEFTIDYPEATDENADPLQRLTPGTELETDVGQFLEQGAGGELNPERVAATAVVRNPRRAVLTIRFDRRDADLGGPGTYTGAVSVVDPRVSRADLAFTVTLAYPWWQFVGALMLVMLVFATLYLWLLRGSFGSRELTLAELQSWIFSRNALLSIGTGFAAAMGAWTASYFNNPSWGTSITAATALFGTAFSAFVAAGTAVTAAGASRGRVRSTLTSNPVSRPSRGGHVVVPGWRPDDRTPAGAW